MQKFFNNIPRKPACRADSNIANHPKKNKIFASLKVGAHHEKRND
ncbi:MAG: hypothetical protein WBV81_21085 [Ignavibacteriaceae bacterium]